MNSLKALFTGRISLIAASISITGSAGYLCMVTGPLSSYSFCRQIALIGEPGILLAAVVLMAVGHGVHGGGPIGKLLLIATPINFLMYLVICLAVTKIAKVFTGRQNL
jgi:hypothetical protein